jgi:V-type H+-transporting ATPase subunit C
VRYRIERPLSDLLNNLHKEINAVDSQVRTKTSQYQAAKATLIALDRKQTGTLATRSLASLIDATVLVQNSEFIETHLIVVPISGERTFFSSYETICPMVVPRSATIITRDSEFVLFSVSTFKKHSNDFLTRCRDNRWTPRPFRYTEDGHEKEQREIDEATNQEAKLLNDLLRITRTSWAESITIWIHVLMLQIFVEDVLRYGLPLRYISHIVETNSKLAPKLRKNLAKAFSSSSGLALSMNPAEISRSDNDAAFMSDLVSLGVQPDDDFANQSYVYHEFFLP